VPTNIFAKIQTKMLTERKNKFKHTVLKHFGMTPTEDQQQGLDTLTQFLFDVSPNPLFVLKGYAGTGKTSLIGAFIKTCDEYKVTAVLMAPTGRAAKVLASHSNKQASTIHKRIYFRTVNKNGEVRYTMQQNLFKKAIFIVDEASMIGDTAGDFGRSVLEDLLSYVYSGEHCRLLFVGDNAQLPPVGLSDSPALEANYLTSVYPLSIHAALLKQVMRQTNHSGILYNATWLRVQLYQNPTIYPKLNVLNFKDIVKIEGVELSEYLEKSYANYGAQGAIVITRSNKNANIYNRQIRSKIKWLDSEIECGDIGMVVKNNYYWIEKESDVGFIANGDFFEVIKITRTKELYGYVFVEATIKLLDYPEFPAIETILWLNTLSTETAAMPEADMRKLYNTIALDYEDISDRKKRKSLLNNNPYLNALQVKFGYCITCHKSQGGQWEDVYIDPGYITDEMINEDFYRWLYTAITRATKQVYLINFKPNFFDDETNL